MACTIHGNVGFYAVEGIGFQEEFVCDIASEQIELILGLVGVSATQAADIFKDKDLQELVRISRRSLYPNRHGFQVLSAVQAA